MPSTQPICYNRYQRSRFGSYSSFPNSLFFSKLASFPTSNPTHGASKFGRQQGASFKISILKGQFIKKKKGKCPATYPENLLRVGLIFLMNLISSKLTLNFKHNIIGI